MSLAEKPRASARASNGRLEDAVRKALEAGLTWQQIGAQIGLSRSDARRRYRRMFGIDRHRI